MRKVTTLHLEKKERGIFPRQTTVLGRIKLLSKYQTFCASPFKCICICACVCVYIQRQIFLQLTLKCWLYPWHKFYITYIPRIVRVSYQLKYHSWHLGLDPAGDTPETSIKIPHSINPPKGQGSWSMLRSLSSIFCGWGVGGREGINSQALQGCLGVSARDSLQEAQRQGAGSQSVCTYKLKARGWGRALTALHYTTSFPGDCDHQSGLGIRATKAIKMRRTATLASGAENLVEPKFCK